MAGTSAEREEKFQSTIKHLHKTIEEKDAENDKLEARITDLEVRIGKLNCEKAELGGELLKMSEEAKQFDKIIADKDMEIEQVKNDILHD